MMTLQLLFPLVLAHLPLNLPLPVSCLWDYDTLSAERGRFPSALELISGKFPRHSRDFYKWRLAHRQQQLNEEPRPEIYDDIAVSYEKLGETHKAIEVALEKEQAFPGLYETYANLGTFYIHDQQYEEGLRYIDKAIAINPNAHFGREVYQRLVVQYLISKKWKEKLLPLDSAKSAHPRMRGFTQFLLLQLELGDAEKEQQCKTIEKAIQGVLGMMRFGNYDSPVLLEILGDLLYSSCSGEWEDGASRLAARAYLKASFEVDDQDAQQEYRTFAQQALSMQLDTTETNKSSQRNLDVATVEKRLMSEVETAEEWFAQLTQDEIMWIKSGEDPEANFNRKYIMAVAPRPNLRLIGILLMCALVALSLACYLGVKKRKPIDSPQETLS